MPGRRRDPYKQLRQAMTVFDLTPYEKVWRTVIDGLLGGRVESENHLELLELAQEGLEDILQAELADPQRICAEQALALCHAEQARVWQVSALSHLPRRGRATDAARAVLSTLDDVRGRTAKSLGVSSSELTAGRWA